MGLHISPISSLVFSKCDTKTINIVIPILFLMQKKYKKITLRFTPLQLRLLDKEKEQTGNTLASIIRRAVDKHIFEE